MRNNPKIVEKNIGNNLEIPIIMRTLALLMRLSTLKHKRMKNEKELILEMLEKRFKQHSDDIDALVSKLEEDEYDMDEHDEMIYSESAYQEVEIIINFIKSLNK